MAADFTIYQVDQKIDIDNFHLVLEVGKSIFDERRPIELRDIKNTLISNGNPSGDDFVEILPKDYSMFMEYVDLSKHEIKGCKFVCCVI